MSARDKYPLGRGVVYSVDPDDWHALCDEVDAWKAVAVALIAELADICGYDPTSTAVVAYNHARNSRHTEALGLLS